MKVGVVAVHGVIPQVRYGFQDDVAKQLCKALNDQKNGFSWTMTVVLPKSQPVNASDVPTISRVHRSTDSADQPKFDFFDVHEAYWSPIDKGKTGLMSVLSWLLRTMFLPFNNFARYRETPAKVAWDIGYIGLAITIASCLLLLSALLFATALRDVLSALCANGASAPAALPHVTCYSGSQPPFRLWDAFFAIFHKATWHSVIDFGNLFTMLAFMLSPLTFLKTLGPSVIVGLVCGVIGSFLAWQVIRAVVFLLRNLPEFGRRDPVQLISRLVATAVLAAIAVVLLRIEWNTRLPSGWTIAQIGVFFIAAAAAFNLGRYGLSWFITNFFGDVQIYTTRNQNSVFFDLREQILQKVTTVFLNVLKTSPAGVPYDRVYILAHSLGSTISMDALLRLYNTQSIARHGSAGSAKAVPPVPDAPILSPGDWGRLRAFVTFGTSLEKTKYFFNVWNATPAQEWEQWNAVVYGSIFTADHHALGASDNSLGILWHNNWFFSDFVSDKISTYRSFLRPGEPVWQNPEQIKKLKTKVTKGQIFIGRLVAANRSCFGPWPKHIETHTWYVQEPWFWHPNSEDDFAVVDVLTAGCVTLAPSKPHARMVLDQRKTPSKLPNRVEPIPSSQTYRYRAWEVVK